MTKMAKTSWNQYPVYDQNGLKNHTLWGRTYLFAYIREYPTPGNLSSAFEKQALFTF